MFIQFIIVIIQCQSQYCKINYHVITTDYKIVGIVTIVNNGL